VHGGPRMSSACGKMARMSQVLLAVDGNSPGASAYHHRPATGVHSRTGRPTWAVRVCCPQLVAAVERSSDVDRRRVDDPDASHAAITCRSTRPRVDKLDSSSIS